MGRWRADRPPGSAGLPFGVWWALGEALTVPALLLSLKLLRLI